MFFFVFLRFWFSQIYETQINSVRHRRTQETQQWKRLCIYLHFALVALISPKTLEGISSTHTGRGRDCRHDGKKKKTIFYMMLKNHNKRQKKKKHRRDKNINFWSSMIGPDSALVNGTTDEVFSDLAFLPLRFIVSFFVLVWFLSK